MDVSFYIPQRVGISNSNIDHINQSGTYGSLSSEIWPAKYTWLNYRFIRTMSRGSWLQHIFFAKWNHKLHYLHDILDDFDPSGQIWLHHIYTSRGLSYNSLRQWISFTKPNCHRPILKPTSIFLNGNHNFDSLAYILWSHCLSSSLSGSNQTIPTIEIDVQVYACYDATTNGKSVNSNITSSHVTGFISGFANYVLW